MTRILGNLSEFAGRCDGHSENRSLDERLHVGLALRFTLRQSEKKSRNRNIWISIHYC